MRFDKAVKSAYERKVPKGTRKKVAAVWKSEQGNYARKKALHSVNKFAAKHKDAALATLAAAGGTAGGYVGGPEGAAIGAFMAEKYGRKAYDAGQKLGRGQERRIDRRIQRGFEPQQTSIKIPAKYQQKYAEAQQMRETGKKRYKKVKDEVAARQAAIDRSEGVKRY